METVIRGGLIISSEDSHEADIRIRQEKIVEIGKNLVVSEDVRVVDAKGCYVFPGFIDTHTHFDLDAGTFRTADDFETGTIAAIAGGTTTILDFTTQEKGESLIEALDNWHKMAEGKCSCDYGFHMSVTDWNEEIKKQIPIMAKEGVTSYKLYMAYDNLRVSDGEIYDILKEVAKVQGIIGVHCENGELINKMTAELKEKGALGPFAHPKSRPPAIEAEAIYRLLTIAKMAGTPVNIVHVSSKAGFLVVKAARARGQKVYVESCPQYFILDESKYELPGFEGAKYVLSPPLRRQEDIDCLWQALQEGQIDTIGTDHCSFRFQGQKERGIHDFSKIPNGIPGVGQRPMLLFSYGVNTKRITKEQMCRVLSENPARLFGMYPQKGTIQVGSDADLVIWNPQKETVISADNQMEHVDYTPYEGIRIKGMPETVFLRGIPVYNEGRIVKPKQGKYLFRGKSKL